MTDARYPERWLSDRRILRLSDQQHRTFVVTLAWTVSNRTDGVIEHADLPLIVGCDVSSPTLAALEERGLWERTADGWVIVDWTSSQTTRDELKVLENARRREREKKQRQRGKQSVPGDVPGDASPGTAQERQGQARQGQASVNGRSYSAGVEAVPWGPVAVSGGAE